MPELPEVETVKRGLERTIVGKTIGVVNIREPKIFSAGSQLIDRALVGASVVRIERRAKVLFLYLSSGWVIAVHLKMTGQLIVEGSVNFAGGHPEKEYDQPLPHKHTHVIIKFSDDATLYYNDLRKFGWMKLLKDQNQESGISNSEIGTVQQFLNELNLGPEPLEKDFTLEYFQNILKHKKTAIKPLLLDQKFIAGVGNIYADEALFAAKVLPTRKANFLSSNEVLELFSAIKNVLALGIKHGGTTMNNYRNVSGSHGGMRAHLKVYGRAGKQCVRCGAIICSRKIGQRTATYCGACQK